MAKILALGGDGIGPDILNQGLRIIDMLAVPPGLDIEFETGRLHVAAYEASGTFSSDETLACARRADAVLVGTVGGCKQSGYGRENGWQGMPCFHQSKSVWLATNPHQPDPFG